MSSGRQDAILMPIHFVNNIKNRNPYSWYGNHCFSRIINSSSKIGRKSQWCVVYGLKQKRAKFIILFYYPMMGGSEQQNKKEHPEKLPGLLVKN